MEKIHKGEGAFSVTLTVKTALRQKKLDLLYPFFEALYTSPIENGNMGITSY